MTEFWDPARDPVLCSPYDPPDKHWTLNRNGQAIRGEPPKDGRREPVSIGVPQDRKSDDQTTLTLQDRKTNELVSRVRDEVGGWRDNNYPGVTATTLRLLHHWTDPQAMKLRPFFAQVEAIETLIWLREVSTRQTAARRDLSEAARRHNDGIVRLCSKMATGTGKTAVMGMAIAWQTLNAARSTRVRNVMHTDRFVVFAPGHTVRDRLGVLLPSASDNVYDEMGIVPHDLRPLMNRAKIQVVNFQAFTQRELIDDSSVRKLLGKGNREDIESWEAAVRRVLDSVVTGHRSGICVINDEAHHCYLPPPRSKSSSDQKAEDSRAAVWFNAIRSLRDMGMLGLVDNEHGQAHPVLDFSATPLWIDTASKSEPEQFQWVSSDFGLMDAIESGLVKVPRVPIDDDSTRDETVWRKLYTNTNPKDLTAYLKSDTGTGRLPSQLHEAVVAVVADWEKTLRVWQEGGQPTPPVIIFVVNSIKNATALYEYLAGYEDEDGVAHPGAFPELSNVDLRGGWHTKPRTLVVHSKVAQDDAIPAPLKKLLLKTLGLETQKDAETAVREMLNTVGKSGQPGQNVRCVVSVGMLTEGWDARTVTHIVGFRAFGTQLLCEQVTGRALRRTSYDSLREPNEEGKQLFEPEYADVVGIPFEFMPDVGEPEPVPSTPKPRTSVFTVDGRRQFRVAWPQVVEYLRVAPQGHFTLDPNKVSEWKPSHSAIATMTAMEGVAGDSSIITTMNENERARTLQVRLAGAVVNQFQNDQTARTARDGTGGDNDMEPFGRASLFRSAFQAVGQWMKHPKVALDGDNIRRVLADQTRTRHAIEAILSASDLGDIEKTRRARLAKPPIQDTSNIRFETTLSHIYSDTTRSELSHAACHSHLEFLTAQALDKDARVLRWARNFQLGWTIPYFIGGVWRRYEPDFVAAIDDNGRPVNLVIECKGTWDEKAIEARKWTLEHWIPCLAGTTELSDELHHWAYGEVTDHHSVQHQIDIAITTALRKQ